MPTTTLARLCVVLCGVHLSFGHFNYEDICGILPSPEIDALYQKRRELLDLFRSEQLAFSEQLRQQSEVNRVQRDQNRAVREERRKYR